jgi:glycosyltransferase involved in cell wall biosynthesis
MGYNPEVSIILCAYNEESVIENALEKVDHVMVKTGWNYEIILVDDGSSDNTRQKAIQYRDKNGNGRLKVIGYEKNRGKGNAIRVGFTYAKGKFVVTMDGDLDINPILIPRYIEALKKSDIAIASKWHRQSHVAITLRRKILSFGFNILSRLFTGIKMRDTQSGLKAFRRKVLERMSPRLIVNQYAFDLELMAACNHTGFNIVELPVDANIRGTIGFVEILRMSFDVLKIAHRLRVLKYYQRDQLVPNWN